MWKYFYRWSWQTEHQSSIFRATENVGHGTGYGLAPIISTESFHRKKFKLTCRKDRNRYQRVHQEQNFGDINDIKNYLGFRITGRLWIGQNIVHKKQEECLITFKSRNSTSRIDHFIIRRKDLNSCKNFKVISDSVWQHITKF